jgi:hypothetical protein
MRRPTNVEKDFRLRDNPASEAELLNLKLNNCAEYTEQTMTALEGMLEDEHPSVCMAACAQLAAYYCHKTKMSPIQIITVMVEFYNGLGQQLELAAQAKAKAELPEKSTTAESILRTQN